MLQSTGSQRVGHNLATKEQQHKGRWLEEWHKDNLGTIWEIEQGHEGLGELREGVLNRIRCSGVWDSKRLTPGNTSTFSVKAWTWWVCHFFFLIQEHTLIFKNENVLVAIFVEVHWDIVLKNNLKDTSCKHVSLKFTGEWPACLSAHDHGVRSARAHRRHCSMGGGTSWWQHELWHLESSLPAQGVLWLLLQVKVSQSCPTLCDPMDYTVHGIF